MKNRHRIHEFKVHLIKQHQEQQQPNNNKKDSWWQGYGCSIYHHKGYFKKRKYKIFETEISLQKKGNVLTSHLTFKTELETGQANACAAVFV